MRLYGFHDSGNGYKVRLLLAMLGIDHEYVEMDILAGETRTPAFLEKNANGRIPVLELDDGTCLAESDAILFYLAEGTPLLPADRLDRARVLQWTGCVPGWSGSAACRVTCRSLIHRTDRRAPFNFAKIYCPATITLLVFGHWRPSDRCAVGKKL